MDNQDEYFSKLIERSEQSKDGIEIPSDLSTEEFLEWLGKLNSE